MVDTNTTVGLKDAHSNTFYTTTTSIASYRETGTSVTKQEPTLTMNIETTQIQRTEPTMV